MNVRILTPDPYSSENNGRRESFTIKKFRYAPRQLQLLAHQPGGIPVTLSRNRLLYLLLPSFLISFLFNILTEAKKSDLIHANWIISGVISGVAGLVYQIPVITTVRGADVTRLESSFLDRLLTRLCLMSNQLVICVSPALHDSLVKFFPNYKSKLRIIPNGVETALLDINRSFNRKQNGNINLITVGSLIPRKSIDTIIKALPSCINATLTIIGDGPLRRNLENLCTESGVKERVFFRGSINPESVADELAKADIFILSSKSEGRPNVVLEAMAAGLPVICSNITGVTDFLRDGLTALVFRLDDAAHLAECIMKLSEDPDLYRTLCNGGRNYIIDNNLTWDKCAASYHRLYLELVSNQQAH